MKKRYLFILSIFLFSLLYLVIHFNLFKEKSNKTINLENSKKTEELDYNSYSSNIMNDISYSSIDLKGNKYTINAEKAEADFQNRNILFLTNVKAIINLVNSEKIQITSDYGKYNSTNYDTIFSENVIIRYLNNSITSGYLDFSLQRNSMIITKNVIYTNLENVLKADVVEMDIKTKDSKIYMLENQKKINIKSKSLYGNN
tara:strand:+ start:2010 stop:2612 length:603 start_codon:yes stop_codon:yes gene_type:complete